LTQYHGTPENQVPRSWLLTFTDGSDEVRAQCYLHGDNYAPQGWYDKVWADDQAGEAVQSRALAWPGRLGEVSHHVVDRVRPAVVVVASER
jgi:hypothetical protein